MMRHVLFAAICLVLLFFPSCAGEPNRTIVKEIRILEDGLELISGRNSAGRIVWMGLRSRTSASSLRLTPSHPVFDEEHLLSNHHGDDFQDPDVMAGLTGSPHYPVRLRSGKPQDVLGLFRVDGITVSSPNLLHDAVGFTSDQTPVLLRPKDQKNWIGDGVAGFYAILQNGTPVRPVPTRDAVSAVGWSADNELLILLVSRGRRGTGFTYDEAGRLMKNLGADYALAMDGGGSARLTWRDGDEVRSFPADRFYRAVPNRLLLSR
jgi:hypothetical protein